MNRKVVGNIGFFNYHHPPTPEAATPPRGAVLQRWQRLVVMEAAHPLLALLVMATATPYHCACRFKEKRTV